MAAYFFDNSGLVKRHVVEAGSAWVRSLVRPDSGHTVFLARIKAVEVFAAITRRQRGGSLTPAAAAAILGHFRRHLGQRYHVVEFTPTLTAEAMLLARRHGLRAYDAVQLAPVRQVDQLYRRAGLSVVTLVSADRELNAAATAEGLAVDDPSQH